MDELLHWFKNDPREIKDHLQQAACIIAGSKEFKGLPGTERSNWLFRHMQLINYFQKHPVAGEPEQNPQ